jgi:ABC-2 type transport system ATP-binding protein
VGCFIRAALDDLMDAIVIENLTHVYAPQRRGVAARTALDGLSFSVQRGEIFGLLGPNGGGKTTTFHILATYFPPTSGRARILGEDVAIHPERVRERLGVVFQNPSVDKKLSVYENLMHQGHLYGLHGADLQERIDRLLQRVALKDRARDLVEVLSGGLRRRVEVAKGLLHKPAVLLLDEPSTGLDPGARRDLWDYLAELKAEGMTMLVTTHLMEEAEKCDRVAIVHQGKRVALGTPQALKDEIGGDVISIDTADPEALAREITARFSVEARVLDGTLRIERDHGHAFIPELVGAFPGKIRSVTLGKPTLEDVFIRKTGHRFWNAEAEAR